MVQIQVIKNRPQTFLASNETSPLSVYIGAQRGLVDGADGGRLWRSIGNTGMGLENPWAEVLFDCE
jgi:hypothetical protein